jgi:hypothetical protein
MRKVSTLASFVVVGVLSITAPLATSSERIHIQAGINPDGNGRLLVNSGEGPWAWEACTPDLTTCAPFGNGREIETIGASPGTVFRVEGNGATGVSPEWRGRVNQVKPPSIDGLTRANEFVSPVPGMWSGGWKNEFSQVQLSACATPAGQDCMALTDLHYVRNCAASASFALDAKVAGSYLRIAQSLIGAGPPVEPSYAVTSPYGGEVWGRSRITSVAVVGQIAPAVNPYPGECGPPPRGRAFISKQGVALIECPAGCRAALIGSRNGRHVRITRSLPARDALIIAPPARLRVPDGILAGTGAGSVHLVAEIDGNQVAQRTITSHAERH